MAAKINAYLQVAKNEDGHRSPNQLLGEYPMKPSDVLKITT